MIQNKNNIIPYICTILLLTLFFSSIAFAEKSLNKSDIKGYVIDAKSGEALPYANIRLKGTNRGTTTNTDGYFVLVDVPIGKCSIQVNYIGYISKIIEVKNTYAGITPLIIGMKPTVIALQGVTVTAQAEMLDVSAKQVSQVTFSPRQLSSLPNIGEVDIFRTMQLLPGISGANEGESGLYVRGGTPDQNLILFDGMTIYHVDHFFGFFSAFNTDAIKDIQLIKGGFPAKYGGRLSSVINLTGKTGNKNKRQFGFGANLLSANAYFETPVFNKGTFLIAGRRSYTDFIRSSLYDNIYGFVTGDDSGGIVGGQVSRKGGRAGAQSAEFLPSFYFYDFNSKLTLNLSSKDIINFSIYSGKDNLDKSQDYSNMPLKFSGTEESTTLKTTDYTRWGNMGFSGKWSRQWQDRFHTDMLLAYSKYFSDFDRTRNLSDNTPVVDDSVSNVHGFSFASKEDNTVNDLTFRLDADWFVTKSHTLNFGFETSQFDSKYLATLNDTTEILNKANNSLQYSLYLQDRWKVKSAELTLGLRSIYYQETARKLYLEPRASINIPLTDKIQLKGAWGHYHQFVNRIINEKVSEGSTDFWFLADDNLKPSFAEHYICGLSYENNHYVFSADAYYKDLDNLIEFSRRYNSKANYNDRFFIGTGVAKGLEFLAQKKRGKLTGWVGYTLGKVEHTFPAFNNGKPFPASHDRRHEVNIVAKYNWGPWTFSTTWVFASGKAYTAPESQYYLDLLNGETESYIHVSDKNSNRLLDYHRLDLSISRKFESNKLATEMGISVFNAYNHKNVWYREYNLDTTPITITDALMLGFTPTVYFKMKLK
ncbi:TonB-dependent receptor [bacterium]|nr:TonB-dependent receptor [bacterium]